MKLPKCSDVRRALLRQNELSAVDRGLLEIHLRRCPECSRIASEFSTIESPPTELAEVTEDRQRNIYNRLVPTVHELTSGISPTSRQSLQRVDRCLDMRLVAISAAAVFVLALCFAVFALLT